MNIALNTRGEISRLINETEYRVITSEFSRENGPTRGEKHENFPLFGVLRPIEKALFSEKKMEKSMGNSGKRSKNDWKNHEKLRQVAYLRIEVISRDLGTKNRVFS